MLVTALRPVPVKCLKRYEHEAVTYVLCGEGDCKFLLSGFHRMKSERMRMGCRIVGSRQRHTTICNKAEHRGGGCYMRSLQGSWSLYGCHSFNLNAFKERYFYFWANFCLPVLHILQFLSDSYVDLSVRVHTVY
jgi:hypothetical protein